jgi:hypothetical protein
MSSTYQQQKNVALVRIRSKRRKGIDVAIWARDGKYANSSPRTRDPLPSDAYSITWRAQYYSKGEQRFIDKKALFFEEAVELGRLLLVAVRWICDDAGIPYPTAEDFGLEELDIVQQPDEQRGNGNYQRTALPRVEDLFDQQTGFDPVKETQTQAYDEDEIV